VTGNSELIAEIRREIARNGGRITFCRFMELALYHPQFGYYCSREPARGAGPPSPDDIAAASRLAATGRPRIGKEGDYFTSVSVGPVFGRILARQFQQWGVDEVVEFGGHRGQLQADVLAVAPELRYRVVEVGEELPATINGVVFSNELLDALPVHRVCGGKEVYVTGDFTEELGPLSDPRLPRLPDGYRSEINLRALDWLADVVRRLKRGYILTIDYGFERPEYFAPHHAAGHLQCYYRHTKNGDPYQHIGEQDITAHVEFSSLIELGAQLGLETVQFTDQAHYLLAAGEGEIAGIVQRDAGKFSPARNAIHQLLHSTMGQAFKVLIQRRA
jgi:SAM-dependent MidA family methyltransferase